MFAGANSFAGGEMKKRDTYNSLSHDKFYKLTRFIDDTKELYAGLSDSGIAAKAAEHLAFTVTQANVLSARRVLGIQKKSKPKVGERNHDRVRTVAGATLMLFKELGIDPPEDLQRIWRKQA